MKKIGISLALAMAAIVLLSFISVSTSVSAASPVSAAGAPAAISTNGVNLQLFVLGSDSNIYTKNAIDGSTWGTSTNLGAPTGGAASYPSAVHTGDMTVFVRGADAGLYSTTSHGKNWAENVWTKYGGGGLLKAGTGPSAVNATTVFVTGTNSHLYVGTLNTTSGNFSWLGRGGILTSSPAAVKTSTGVTVFVGGVGGTIYSITNTGGVWSTWYKVGGQLLAGTSPSAYAWSNGRVGVFAAGTTRALYERFWQGTTVSSWANLGGVLTTSPGATAKLIGNTDVFATGTVNQFTGTATIYQKSYTSGPPNYGWGDWTAIGGL